MIQRIRSFVVRYWHETSISVSGLSVDVLNAYVFIILEHGLNTLDYVSTLLMG